MNTEHKSFAESLVFFIALNLFLLGIFFKFVPIYPWWFFVLVAALVKLVVPALFLNNRR